MTGSTAGDTAGLDLRQDGAVAILTLSRPERLNALSHALVDELRATVTELDADGEVRALVLTGAGRAFSAGADLSGGPSDAGHVVREHYNPLVRTLTSSRLPIVAAVNGIAAGAAVSIAAACDVRIASTEAAFQLSFVRVGLVPDAGATWLLPRIIGLGRTQELALLGRKVDAGTAERWGLVSEVVAAERLTERAIGVAAELAALSSSVGTTKKALHTALAHDLDQQLELEAALQGAAQTSPDYIEARAAFRERRKPVFTDPDRLPTRND